MLDQLLTLVFQLPIGILIAAGLLECFVLFKDRRDAEPAVLWLLCCATVVGLLCAGIHFLMRGTADYAIWVALASAAAAVGFWFKRQARNLGVASLKDRFYPPGSYVPVQMPNQTTFILGYRASLIGALGLTLVGLLVGKVLVPGTGGDAAAVAANPPVAPAAPAAPAAAPADPAAPTAPAVAATNPPAPTDPATPGTPPAADPATPAPADPATPAPAAGTDPAMAGNEKPAAPPAEGTPTPATPGTPPPAGGTPAAVTPPKPDAAPTGPSAAMALADMRPISKNSIFGSKIRPLIQKHCITCHGAEKQKGDLRLDTPDFIRTGVRGKAVIVAGKPDSSSLLASIMKPPGDEDRMPPKGDGISAGDAALIKKWIAAGADYGDGVTGGGADHVEFAEDKIAAALQAPPAALIEELKKDGVLVRPASKDGKVLELDFSHTDYAAGQLKLERLKPISNNIRLLDFSRTRIDDNDIANLAGMPHLAKLILSRTDISDVGIAHLKGLTQLEYLNIYQTKVTDAGLKNLESMSKLQKLYAWQSMVTPAGADGLQGKIKGLVINMGGNAPPPAEKK